MSENNFIAGIWKFHERVGNKDLLEVAREWAKDDNYIELFIRQTSKDQRGICFIYKHDGTKEKFDKYFDEVEVTDKLKRNFGNDLVGWDISQEVQIVKGIE